MQSFLPPALIAATLSCLTPLAAQAAAHCEVIVYGGGAPWRFILKDGDGLNCAKLLHNEGGADPLCLQETTAEAPDTRRYQQQDSKDFWDLRADGLITGYVQVLSDENAGIDMIPFGGTCQEVV